jgi:LacI family transcriptional regulator
MMLARSVEGIIAVDTLIKDELPVPLVVVSGHERRRGVVNIELDHVQAARLALVHLQGLGHKRIAFIKGQALTSDIKPRWQAIVNAAKELSIRVDAKLVVQLSGAGPGLVQGYEVTRELLKARRDFSAIFAFNDNAAMGAIRALHEAGLRVPEDLSVMGFDDVLMASTIDPPLTTIHQPLRAMGEAAASTLLELIREDGPHPRPDVITVYPKLVVRKSTGPAAVCCSSLGS